MQNNLPLISVIVPVHNSARYLADSLSSIISSDYPLFELIVVDDGSTDNSSEIVKRYTNNLVTLKKKSGPSKARNTGAWKSAGKILLFLDADVRIAPDTISRIAKAMTDDSGAAAIFGSYDKNPSDPGFFSQYKNLFHHFIHQNAKTTAGTFWSGCGAMRKKIFMEAGGFSEKYPYPAIEDVKLGYTLISMGKKIKLLKELQVTHLKKINFFSAVKTDIIERAIPWTRLAFERGGIPYDLNFKLKDRISGVISILILLTLILAWRWRFLIFIFIALSGIFLYLNRDLYKFFYKTKAPAFVLAGALFNWFYFLYSSIVFISLSSLFFIHADRYRNKEDR